MADLMVVGWVAGSADELVVASVAWRALEKVAKMDVLSVVGTVAGTVAVSVAATAGKMAAWLADRLGF